MYRNISIWFILMTSLTVLSCVDDSFFELDNPPVSPWPTLTEFENAATGTYWAAFRRSQWSNLKGGPVLLKTVQSDIAQLLPGTTGDIPFNEMYNRLSDREITKTTNIFTDAYRTINIANSGLQFLVDNNGLPYENLSDDDFQNLRRIEGELLFMRGYTYWLLSTVFLPNYGEDNNTPYIPLRTTFDEKINGIRNPRIGTVEEIYATIVDDFEKAKELLPERYISGLHHPSYAHGRANAFAAASMLAKVYFMMGKNEEALEELDYVIDQNGGTYVLDQDPIEAFNRDDNTSGNEVIWYALYYDPISRVNAFELTSMTLQSFNAKNGGNTWPNGFSRISWNQFALSDFTLDQIGWLEDPLNGNYTITSEALKDKRFNQLYRPLKGFNSDIDADPSEYETIHPQINKTVVWCDKYFRGKTRGILTNIPLIRLAELYLTRALLRFRTGNLQGATEDINMVRVRAGLDSLVISNLTEDKIHTERIKELAFEGDRIDYLRASKSLIPSGDRPNTQALPPNHPSFIWKIPQREMDLVLGL